jgi:hypothetical protein
MAQAGLEPRYANLLSQRSYNDTTSTISYTGDGWNYSSGRAQGDLDDDVHYSYAAGATVTIPFTGSGISWLAQRSDQTGPVEVYVDGSDQGMITPRTSGAPYPAQQVGYSISGLAAGDHTLRIVNQSSRLMTVDGFTVSASRPTTNDTANTISYEGKGWKRPTTSGAGDDADDLHTPVPPVHRCRSALSAAGFPGWHGVIRQAGRCRCTSTASTKVWSRPTSRRDRSRRSR